MLELTGTAARVLKLEHVVLGGHLNATRGDVGVWVDVHYFLTKFGAPGQVSILPLSSGTGAVPGILQAH